MNAYLLAIEQSHHLLDSHPLRLSLCLNFAVFHHEILGETMKACEICQEAITNSMDTLEDMEKENYKEAEDLINLLRSNKDIWEAEYQAKQDENIHEN